MPDPVSAVLFSAPSEDPGPVLPDAAIAVPADPFAATGSPAIPALRTTARPAPAPVPALPVVVPDMLPVPVHGAGPAGVIMSPSGWQVPALDRIIDELVDGGRARITAACGTGKSLTAIHSGLELAPAGLVAVTVPSQALLIQTYREWAKTGLLTQVLGVCSSEAMSVSMIKKTGVPCLLTTDPGRAATWLRYHQQGLRLLLTTNLSAPHAGDALQEAGQQADLLIIDEAHHTAGRADKRAAAVHDNTRFPATRRLYMTATPRIIGKTTGGDIDETFSMDDDDLYGPLVAEYTFAAARADGRVDDYRIVAIGVTRADVREVIEDAAGNAVTADSTVPVRTAVLQAAVLRAISEFGLRRIAVFTSRVSDSQTFARTLPHTIARLPEHLRPTGPVDAVHVDSTTTSTRRDAALHLLEHPPENGTRIVSNARCLREGVNIPALDAAVFTRPRAEIDTVQIVGRITRPHTGMSYVIVPILVDMDDPDPDLGEWETLFSLLRALRAHDERLAFTLDRLKSRHLRGDRPALPEQVLVRMPDGVDTPALLTHIVPRLLTASTTTWHTGITLLRKFRDERGHVKVPDGYHDGGINLYRWLRRQIRSSWDGTLSPDRTQQLRDLGVDLTPPVHGKKQGLAVLQKFYATHGHLHPPSDLCIDGIYPNRFLHSRRIAVREGRHHPLHDELTRMDPTWTVPRRQNKHWDNVKAALLVFYHQHGHLQIPAQTVINDINLYSYISHRIQRLSDGTLPDEQLLWLNAKDPDWAIRVRITFDHGYAAAKAFYDEHGHLNVPVDLRIKGIRLNKWLITQRTKYKKKLLTDAQIAALEAIGMDWDPRATYWDRGLAAARAFYARHGHLQVPDGHLEDGFALRPWTNTTQIKVNTGKLSAQKTADAAEVGLFPKPSGRRRAPSTEAQ